MLSIQYLRAAAAIAVVVYHSGTDAHWRDAWPLKGFASGVDVFFVISGFIMWITTARSGMSPRDFWRRRIERIVPLYWIATTFAVLVALVYAKYGGKADPWRVISSYLFLPAHNPQTHRIEPVLSPGWTLNYEIVFYAVFGAFLVASARWRLIGTTCVLAGIVIVRGLVGGSSTPLDFYGTSIVLEFVFGMALGALFTSSRLKLSVPAAWAGLAFGLVALGVIDSVHPSARVIALGLPALFIVGSVLCLERAGVVREWPIPKLLGDASYSIYLAHGVFLAGFKTVYFKTSLPTAGFILASVVGSVVFGLGVYTFIEAPITARIQARRRREHRRVASDAIAAEVVAPDAGAATTTA